MSAATTNTDAQVAVDYDPFAEGPVARVVAMLADDPPRLARFRGEFVALVERFFDRNIVHQSFLMTRALKA